jgi:hypothetical protein
MAKQDDYTRYTIRIPTPLYERVKEAAGEKSVNAEIIAALDDYLTREAQREEGFRWLPPDQQVAPQQLWALERIAKAEGLPLNLMLDAAVSFFIAAKEAELSEGVGQMAADETLSDLMARAEQAAADVPAATASITDMNQRRAPTLPGAWVPRWPKGGKALSDAEMQELKDAVSATVAQELARLLGGAR